jgi:hypothetical protein
MMDINNINKLIAMEMVIPTQHFMYRIENRGITIENVLFAVGNGNIIENYPSDYPHPSALVFGYTQEHRPLHAVVGVGNERLWLITAYIPDDKQWEADMRTRKEVKK